MSHHGAAPVGAPLVTPGARTAQRRDALCTPAEHGRGDSPDVHKRPGGCLRRSSGRHKWRPYGGLCSIRRNGQLLTEPDVHHGAALVGAPLVTPGAGTAQRRDALSTPTEHGRGDSPDVHKRPGGRLRRSSGRHKWRPYGWLCSIRRNGQLLTEPDAASRGSARRDATCDARCRNGTTTGRIVHAGGAWAWR